MAATYEFKREKLERDAQRNWDLFYKRNGTNFFKDRHWTGREFQDLCEDVDFQKSHVLLEAGCGVGNFLLPFLSEFPTWTAFACDFSPRAVAFVKSHADYNPSSCQAFECDLTLTDGTRSLPANVPDASVDLISLVFVLSAVHPDKMVFVLENLFRVLKPGGSVVIRDYAQGDHAQLRFDARNKLSDNFYARQDGTRAYYFNQEHLCQLFESSAFIVRSCGLVNRQTVNRKENINVDRLFIQGRFQKPAS